MSTKHAPHSSADKIVEGKNNFKGFTIEEVRYRRAVVALQTEFCKEKIVSDAKRLRKVQLFGSGSGTKTGASILSRLNYIDYAMIGFSLFKYGSKIARLFKK